MTSKMFDINKLGLWAGGVAAAGVLLTGLVQFTKFLTLGDAVAAEAKRIDKLEESTQQIAKVLEKQEIINDYIHKQDIKHKEKILSPDGRKYWDETKQEWLKNN